MPPCDASVTSATRSTLSAALTPPRLSGLAFGQTVLSKAVQAAGYSFDSREAHSAVYDAERTALLFCRIVNRLRALEVLELERVGSTLP